MSVKVKDNGAYALLKHAKELRPTMAIRVGIMGSKALERKLHKRNPQFAKFHYIDEDGEVQVSVAMLDEHKRAKLAAAGIGGGAPPDLTIVQVAEKHEFGIGVPRRSFIRDYHDQNINHIKKRLAHYAEKVWKAKNRNQVLTQIDRIGLELVDGIVTRIETGIPPANSQETIDRKGSETPLIDTGQLRSSIIYEVEHGRS